MTLSHRLRTATGGVGAANGAARAIILAAGLGGRLGRSHPKPLVPVAGEPIIHRTIANLAAVGVREVVVVAGHRAQQLKASVGSSRHGIAISYVISDAYRHTNNAYSLWLAREHLTDDVWLLDGDVVFDSTLLPDLLDVDGDVVCALAFRSSHMSGTTAAMTPDGRIDAMTVGTTGARATTESFKTINVYRLTRGYLEAEFCPRLDALVARGDTDSFYEKVIAETVASGTHNVRGRDCSRSRWFEVDDDADLAAATALFTDERDPMEEILRHHGSYWRFAVTDHRLLYNTRFPPPALFERVAQDLPSALVHYPAGQDAMAELLAAAVCLPNHELVVANGASELIKQLPRALRRVALVVPGFNEYEAAYAAHAPSLIQLHAPTFRVEPDRVVHEAAISGAEALIVTTPNNPTSQAIAHEELAWMARELERRGMRLVVDESFVDFASDRRTASELVEELSSLVVIKSMSKAYGIGGIRLGYLHSADRQLLRNVRDSLPIWNVNGVAEAFLRVMPLFQDDFAASCRQVALDAQRLAEALEELEAVSVLPPQANYVLARLGAPLSARAVTEELYASHGILVKDCGGKAMPDGDSYLRLGVRDEADNQRLVQALRRTLEALAASATPAAHG